MVRVVAVVLLCLVLVTASASLCCAGYAKTITVSATGADFTSPAAAVNSITDASATNRYLVKVMPGTYSGRVICKPFVDISGACRTTVILTHDGHGWQNLTLLLDHDVCVENLTVLAPMSDGYGIGGYESYNSLLSNCRAEAGEMAVIAGGMGGGDDREAGIDQWLELRNCSFKANLEAGSLWDNTLVNNCIFTMYTNRSDYYLCGATINGNAIMRNCHVNMTVTGGNATEIGGVWNNDMALPTRLERTSINVRVLDTASHARVWGVKNGAEDCFAGAQTDVDHCSIVVTNRGTGPTYELINVWDQPEWGDKLRVFATKYAPNRVFGMIETISQGDQVVKDLQVTGNLTVTGSTTVVLPSKDRTRILPLVVAGDTVGLRKLLGDNTATPAVGYSFPDNVTITKVTVIGTTPGTGWADPEAQLLLFKNGETLGSVDVNNESGGTQVSTASTTYNVPFTPQDKFSLTLEGMSRITDASIMIEYTVD